MKAIIEEMFIMEEMLNLSLMIEIGKCDPNEHALRVILVWKCKEDERRLPLPNLIIQPDEDNTIVYGSYAYNIGKLFWDTAFDSFTLEVEVVYDDQVYDRIPLETTQAIPIVKRESDSVVRIKSGHYRNIIKGDYAFPHFILIVLLRLLNYLLGIISIPLFLLTGLISFLPGYEEEQTIKGNSPLARLIRYAGRRFFLFCGLRKGTEGFYTDLMSMFYHLASSVFIRKNGVLIISNRRKDLTGNFQFVYDKIKDEKFRIRYWLNDRDPIECSILKQMDFAFKASRSKVILVDDFIPILAELRLSKKTKVLQLWHACGSFKTFGFSRLGKKGAPNQLDEAHRIYDGVFVSSESVCKNYSEGFGVRPDKVYPFGVPRTDIFFDETYKLNMRKRLHETYPYLKDKKVILFAPTFRGNGKQSAYYEKSAFSPDEFIRKIPEDYVLLIKHHPFVNLKYEIKNEFKDRIFDFSHESEINDLLFITDILITDYSSVIYEASILNIPMLFYAYDQEAYLSARDFYQGFRSFVPGKIVRTQDELCESVLKQDFETEKVKPFCVENFDKRDGKSSERIADYIKELMK